MNAISSTAPPAPVAPPGVADAPSTDAAATSPLQSLHSRRGEWTPALLVIAIALLALPLIGTFPTWVTLTLAGLAMGMMLFFMASGLTLVFGLRT